MADRPAPPPAPSRRAHDAEATRRDLLDAAIELFAERGFRDTGVREVADAAGTRAGNVHYHFGGKAGLYREAFVDAHRRLFTEFGVPDVCDEDDPEVALRTWVRYALGLHLLKNTDHAAWRMLHREMQDPSETLDEMVGLVMKPVLAILDDVLGRLLARRDADTPKRRKAAAAKVLAMVIYYDHSVPVVRRLGHPVPRTKKQVDALADEIAAFALAGMGVL